MRRAILLSLALLVLPANANDLGQGIHVRQVAAPIEPLTGVKTVGVAKVEGNWTGTLQDEIEEALKDAERKYPGDSQGVARAAGAMGAAVAASAASALTFGLAAGATHKAVTEANEKKLEAKIRRIEDGLTVTPYKYVTSGADATFAAKVTADSDDNRYTSTERRTENGVSYDATIYCTKRTVSVTVDWSVVDKSGKALVTKSNTFNASRNACEAAVANIPPAKDIAAEALVGAGYAMVNSVLPGWRDHRVDLDSHKSVTDAIKDVKAGDLKSALCKVHTATETEAKSNVPLYDQGALLESLGYLDDAIESYDAADAMKKHKGAQKGKERVEARKEEIKKLESSFGMTYKVGKVDWGTCS